MQRSLFICYLVSDCDLLLLDMKRRWACRSGQQLHRGFDLHNPLPKLVIVTQSHCHRL